MNTLTRSLTALLAAALAGGCEGPLRPDDAALDTSYAISTDAPDGTAPPPVDASGGCSALARCVSGCGSDAGCADRCRAAASPEAVRLLHAQSACVFGDPAATPPVTGACSTAGGVCDSSRPGFSASTCAQCVEAAQRPGGACDAQVTACQRAL